MTEGIIGVAIGAVIALLGSIIMVKFNYHGLFAKTVSEERSKWLKEMREHATALISFLKGDLPVKGQIANENQNFTSLSMPILLRLNPYKEVGSYDKEISDLLMCGNSAKINVTKLQKAFEEMFKEEWEKVKLEAKGSSTNSLTKNEVGVTLFNYAIWSIMVVAFIGVLSMATIYCHNYIGRHFKSDISLLHTSLWIVFGAICLTALTFVIHKVVQTVDLWNKENKKRDRAVGAAEDLEKAFINILEDLEKAVKAEENLEKEADKTKQKLKIAAYKMEETLEIAVRSTPAVKAKKRFLIFNIVFFIAIIIVGVGAGAVIDAVIGAGAVIGKEIGFGVIVAGISAIIVVVITLVVIISKKGCSGKGSKCAAISASASLLIGAVIGYYMCWEKCGVVGGIIGVVVGLVIVVAIVAKL